MLFQLVVTVVNELVDVGTFLRMHLLPELSHANINERPIVKVWHCALIPSINIATSTIFLPLTSHRHRVSSL